MKKVFRFIIRIIILVILLGAITAYLDYTRMSSGDLPIFNINDYNNTTKIQTFKGLFYTAKRKVRVNINESLIDSNSISFKIFSYKLAIPKQFKEETYDYQLEAQETDNCQEPAKVYYVSENIKIYTYCLDYIKVKDNKTTDLDISLTNNEKLLDDILSKLNYLGLNPNSNVSLFQSDDNFSSNLKVYQCHNEEINDIYIGSSNMEYQLDYCTLKDDDFNYLAKVEEELPTDFVETKDEYDLLYEDDNNKYEIEKGKIDYIYLVSKEHRGIPEKKISLREIIDNEIMTIEELQKKGLNIKITKKEETIE